MLWPRYLWSTSLNDYSVLLSWQSILFVACHRPWTNMHSPSYRVPYPKHWAHIPGVMTLYRLCFQQSSTYSELLVLFLMSLLFDDKDDNSFVLWCTGCTRLIYISHVSVQMLVANVSALLSFKMRFYCLVPPKIPTNLPTYPPPLSHEYRRSTFSADRHQSLRPPHRVREVHLHKLLTLYHLSKVITTQWYFVLKWVQNTS